MKKKSILLTCIVAIMALAMFVGCDNAPTLPSFVVGGNVEPGDFLVGQTFNPGKFSVRVDYDNGKSVANDTTAKVVLNDSDSDGKVDVGETATVTYGIDYDGNAVKEVVSLNIYEIKSLAVTAPEVNEEEAEKLRPEDITVVATYLDSANAEKTMTLNSTEYSIDYNVNYVANAPSSAEPQVQAYYNVIPSVGVDENSAKVYGKLYFTAEFVPSKVYTADDIASIEGIALKNNDIYAYNYDYVPRPSFDDIEIQVKFKDVTYPYDAGNDNWVDYDVLTENIEGLELSYVKDGLPLGTGNLVGVTTLGIRVEIGDLRYESPSAVTLKTITVDIEESDSFEAPAAVYTKTALPAIDPADFVVTYTDNNIKDYVPEEDVELVYGYTSAGNVVEVLPGAEIENPGTTLSIYAKYNGVISETSIPYGTTEVAPVPVPVLDSISAVVASGFDVPAKMVSYDTDAIPSDPGVGSVKVTANYTLGGESKTVTAASVVYSTSATAIVEPTATSFNGETPIYLYVTYGEKTVSRSCAVEITDLLSEAYATELDVTFGYSKVTADTASSAVDQQTPMVGATIEDFEVVATNDDGIVAVLDEDEYQFMLDGVFTTAIDPSTYVVGDKDSAEYDVTALLTVDATGKKDYVTLANAFKFKAGEGWIDFESVVDDLEFALASGYDNRVGAEISKDAGDYAVVAESYADAVHAGTDGAPTIKIESVEIVDDGAASSAKGKYIEAIGNSVIFTVKYTDETGEEQSVQLSDVWTFDGVSYVSKTTFGLKYVTEEGETEITDTLSPDVESYSVSNFAVTGYEKKGDVADPTITIYDGNPETGSVVSSNFKAEWGHTYSVVITYTDAVYAEGDTAPYVQKVATETITLGVDRA